MFLHKCRYKNCYFSEFLCSSSDLVRMIYSFKDVIKDLALDFVLLILKAYCLSPQSLSTDICNNWLTILQIIVFEIES